MRAATLSILLLGLSLIAAPAAAQTYGNLGELLDASPQLSILAAALDAAGLEELTMDMAMNATIFAPTDAAFREAFQILNLSAGDVLNNTELLAALLSYHVVPGVTLMASNLTDGQVIQSSRDLPSGELRFYTDMGQPFLRTTSGQAARITQTDLMAGNMVVHVIDAMMVPGDMLFNGTAGAPAPAPAQSYSSLAELLGANPRLTTLAAALELAGLGELGMDASVRATIFAPTNAAFVAVARAMNLSAAEVLNNRDDIAMLLSYHVVSEAALMASDLSAGQVLQTDLDGPMGRLQFYTDMGQPYLRTTSGQAVRITQTDLMAGNMVVHIIDAVLLPGDELFPAPAPAPAA